MTILGHRVTGLAAIAAPLLLLASTLSYIARGEGMNDGEAGGTIQIWAFIAFAVAVVGLARSLEPYAPRAAVVLTVAGLIGAAGGVAYGIDSIQVEVFGTESIQETDSAVVPFALQLPGIMLPLALAALGILLARHQEVPALVGYALTLGALLFPASRIPDIEALAVACDVLLVAALGTIGVRALTEHSRSPRRSYSSATALDAGHPG